MSATHAVRGTALRFLTSAIGLALAAPCGAVTLHPGDVVVAGRVNVSSHYETRILLLDPATLDTTIISVGSLVTVPPHGIAVDYQGRILLASGDAGLIEVNAGNGVQTVLASAQHLGGDAAGICVAPQGHLFVSLRGPTPGVVRLSADGSTVTPVTNGNLLSYPGGLALGPDGALYVTEGGLPADNGETVGGFHGRGSIVRVDPGSGSQTRIAADSLFFGPFDIAFVAPDEVWTTQAGAIAGRRGCIIRTHLGDGSSSQVTEAFWCRSIGIAATGQGVVYGDCRTIGPDCYTLYTARIPAGPQLDGVAGPMAVVPPGVVPVHRTTWGALKTIYR